MVPLVGRRASEHWRADRLPHLTGDRAQQLVVLAVALAWWLVLSAICANAATMPSGGHYTGTVTLDCVEGEVLTSLAAASAPPSSYVATVTVSWPTVAGTGRQPYVFASADGGASASVLQYLEDGTAGGAGPFALPVASAPVDFGLGYAAQGAGECAAWPALLDVTYDVTIAAPASTMPTPDPAQLTSAVQLAADFFAPLAGTFLLAVVALVGIVVLPVTVIRSGLRLAVRALARVVRQ